MAGENNITFGTEWEKEMKKLSKDELINMVRKIQTGTEDKKICQIETANEAQYIVEGIINDFEAGVTTKAETMGVLGNYTGRLMELFWKNIKKKVKEKPDLLN